MRQIKYVLLIIIIIFNSGCWQYKELDELALITAMGIDKVDNEYLVSVQIIEPTEEPRTPTKEGEAASTVFEATGKTITDALNKLSLEIPREIYLGHLKLVAIGEETARQGIMEFIDFFIRERGLNKIFPLIFVQGSTANEAIKIIPPVEMLPATHLINLIRNAEKRSGIVVNQMFDDILAKIYAKGKHPGVTAIKIEGIPEEGEDPENIEGTSPDTKKVVVGMAVMNHDKLIGFLDDKQSIGYNIINKRIYKSVITFKCDENNYASAKINRPIIVFKTDMINNEPFTTLDINVTATLNEYMGELDLGKDENIKKVGKMITMEIKSLLENVIQIAQKEYNTDFLGFGEKLYQNNYREWEKVADNWDEIFSNMDYEVKVAVKMDSTGATMIPVKKGGNNGNKES